jgi:hypothetical protein
MTKPLLLITALLAFASLQAQTFSDDFESYSPGDMLAASSSTWETWTSANGGADDVAVTNNNAHSGTQSVYFASTSASGGPADVVLPFPGELNTGQFNLDMWMYINSGGAYFNLQETGNIGTSWAADVYFTSGAAQFTSGGSLLLECSYPESEWFKLSMHNDMSTNTWEILINDISQGTYANAATQIASMDIYPLQGHQFYVDDVSYSFEPYTLSANNGAAISINNMGSGLSGQQVTPTVTIRNLGAQAINSFDLELTYNGASMTQNVTGVNIASLAFYTVNFTETFTLAAGQNDAVATISNVNGFQLDDDTADDVKTLNVDPIVPAPGKMVVAEEGTGTWCPWCVRGTVFMDELGNRYEGYYIGIAVHNADPMTFDPYDSAMGTLISGYPSGLVDRGPEYDPSQFEIPFLERIQVAPKALIENGAQFDAGTQTLSISASTTFQESVSGDYRIAMVITEDGLSGTTTDWAQANAYAGGANGDMGGFENLPNPVPAASMVYDHVARIISPSFNGLPNAFTGAMMAGNNTVHNFSVSVPDTWNLDNIHIVTMVIAPDGTIENAMSTTLAEAESNGFQQGMMVVSTAEITAPDAAFTVNPNPAREQLLAKVQMDGSSNITLRLLSADGRLLRERSYGNLHGVQVFPIDLSSLAEGLYILQLVNEQGAIQRTFIKE